MAGGADNPYALSLTYGLTGGGHLGSPLGIINGSAIPNQSLTPFQKDEVELEISTGHPSCPITRGATSKVCPGSSPS